MMMDFLIDSPQKHLYFATSLFNFSKRKKDDLHDKTCDHKMLMKTFQYAVPVLTSTRYYTIVHLEEPCFLGTWLFS